MSYILDAIKKSEAERGHGSIPSLQTVHSSSLSYKTDSKQIWPYILISLLLLNIAGLVYYFTNSNSTKNIQPGAYSAPTQLQHLTTQTQIRSTPATHQLSNTIPEPTTAEAQPENHSQGIAQSETGLSAVTNEVIDVEDLPSHIKQRIPTLDFTGHIYSSSPILRSIIINGSFKEEGDAINYEFTLSEITPGGAIFEYQGTLFEVSIITGWN